MRRPKSRCCESLRTTSVLLRGPKTGRWGVYQIREPKHERPKGAIHEHRNGFVDSDFDVRVWFCAQPVGYATPPSTPTGGLTRRAFARRPCRHLFFLAASAARRVVHTGH